MEEKLNKSEVQFSQTNFWRDFLGFKKMVSPILIKVYYFLGLVIITIWGLVSLINGLSSDWEERVPFWNISVAQYEALFGFLMITLGNLLHRLVCESLIVLFGIFERLNSIENYLKTNKK